MRTLLKGLLSVIEITLFMVILITMFRPNKNLSSFNDILPIKRFYERLQCACHVYDGMNEIVIDIALIFLAFFSLRASLYFLAYCCYFSIIGILFCSIKVKTED